MSVHGYREYFSSLTDSELELRLSDLTDLVPEALQALQAEFLARGTAEAAEAVAIQLEGVSPEELEELVAWVQASPCPACGSTEGPLNAVSLKDDIGHGALVGCHPCLRSAVREASLVRTVGCLVFLNPIMGLLALGAQNLAAQELAAAQQPEPTEALREHVRRNQGPLTAARRRQASAIREGIIARTLRG